MLTPIHVAAAIVALVGLAVVLRTTLRTYRTFRGTRVVTCPETGAPAAVEVDAIHAAMGAGLKEPPLRLRECSQWPERRNCGQGCLTQIELAPADCLARTMLTRWYEGKSCALCGHPVGEIRWGDHKPALLSPDRETLTWTEVRPERLPEVLSTHLAVCWNCHVAETLRRKYPELVVEATGTPASPPRRSAP